MHAILQDLNFAWRQMRKAPGFALMAVITLALGIGANAAMFNVIESVLLRPLPYSHPDRLIFIGPASTSGFGSTSWLNYRDVRDQAQSVEALGTYSEDVGVVQGKEGSVSVVTPNVTPNVFRMLGAQPKLGRIFSDAEGQPGGPQSVILSEKIWRESFSGDPQIVGKTIRVNAKPRVVVGVMPANFRFPEESGEDVAKGIWLPLQPSSEMQTDRGYYFVQVIGQLKSGATLANLQAEVNVAARHITDAQPPGQEKIEFRVRKYAEMITGSVRPVFVALVIALGLVLLIACANVANLLIARCLARQHEFSVRRVLGASRWRLVRQLLCEGALISIFGSLAGFGLASWAIEGVRLLPAGTIPRAEGIGIHWPIVAVLAAIAIATTILSAILPALLASRTGPQYAMLGSSRGGGDARDSQAFERVARRGRSRAFRVVAGRDRAALPHALELGTCAARI